MSLLTRSVSFDLLKIQQQQLLQESSLFQSIYRSASENDLGLEQVINSHRSESSVTYESSLKPPDFLIGYPAESEFEDDSSSSILEDHNYPTKTQSDVLKGSAATVVSRLQYHDKKMNAKARESWAEKLVPDLGSFTSFTSSENCSNIRLSLTRLALRRTRSLDQIPNPVQGKEDELEETSKVNFGYGEHDKYHRRTIFAVRSWMKSLPRPEELVGSEC